jgi:hypothetical protein
MRTPEKLPKLVYQDCSSSPLNWEVKKKNGIFLQIVKSLYSAERTLSFSFGDWNKNVTIRLK